MSAVPGAESRPSLKRRIQDGARTVLAPLARALASAGVSADFLTVMGVVLSVGAGLAFFEGGFRGGATLAAMAGLCDVLDGAVARQTGRVSRFGAFLDSTLDRFAEGLLLTGIAGFYVVNLVELVMSPDLAVEQIQRGLEPRTWAVVALTGMLALVGSFMVSYTRARAEGLGLECKVGWFERPERMVLIILAGAFGVGPVMPAALILLVVMSFVTATQRVVHVWKITRGAGRDT